MRIAAANDAPKSWPRRSLETIYGLYAAGLFCVWLPATWALVAMAPNRWTAEKITKWALRLYFLLIGCRVRVLGREHLHPPPRVFVCNHSSNLDVLVLLGALGSKYHFVAKSEVHSMPFIGTFLRKLGHFAFDRGDPGARVRQSREIQSALSRGESVFIFPEGTFSAQSGVRAFHLGAFHAAAMAQCPIVPIGLDGTRRMLRDKTHLPLPVWIDVVVCAPILPVSVERQDSRQEIARLRDASREAISRAVREPLL